MPERLVFIDETGASTKMARRYGRAGSAAIPQRHAMCEHFEEALVNGYEPLIGTLELPDADDRHVLAAAISGKSWVVGIKGPTSERIGLHSLGSADVEGLGALIERHRTRFEARFSKVNTGYGEPFPPRARREILRLTLIERQIAEVEAERDAVVREGAAFAASVVPQGSEARAAFRIAALTRLKGIGANDATLLTHEIFYRDFRNRRELASWVGMTPTP